MDWGWLRFVFLRRLVFPRPRWFRSPFSPGLVRRWFWSFCVRGGFIGPFRWFAFGAGFDRSACAADSFVKTDGSRLVSVSVVLCVRRLRFICSVARRLVFRKVRSSRRKLAAFK